LARPADRASARPPAQVATKEALDWRRHGVPEPVVMVPLVTPRCGTVDGKPVVVVAPGFGPVSSDRAGETPGELRVFVTTMLAVLQAKYDESKNPVFAWAARLESRRTGAAEPAWVSAYLDRVTQRLHSMSYGNTPQGDVPPAVYRALEFDPRSRSNPFRVIAKLGHDLALALEVSYQIKQLGKVDAAIFHVKNEHPTRCNLQPKCETISYSTVARVLEKHRPYLAQVDALHRFVLPAASHRAR
jgi:hypothetical protein